MLAGLFVPVEHSVGADAFGLLTSLVFAFGCGYLTYLAVSFVLNAFQAYLIKEDE